MLEYACENNLKQYNYYAISGNLSKEDSQYGIYYTKRNFGGKVVELIGEFDLVLNNYVTSELDTLLDIVISKKERKNSIIDIRRKRNISIIMHGGGRHDKYRKSESKRSDTGNS